MSDAPLPPEPEESPSADELRRTAMPAHVRRAPRFRNVIGTGVVIGFVAGALCGLLLPSSTGAGRGTAAILVGLGFALIGGLVTGLIAIGMDRRTPRYLKNAPSPAWMQDAPSPSGRPAGAVDASADPFPRETTLRPADVAEREAPPASDPDESPDPDEERR